MKKDWILIALALGFIIFILRWDASKETFKMQSFACLGIFYAMKRNYNKIRKDNPEFKITFGNAFWLGVRVCFIAAITAGLFYLAMPESTSAAYETSKMIRALDVSLSTVIIGGIVTLISSGIFVYRQF